MTPEIVLSLVLFSLSITLQPGPNNGMFMASGLTYGFWPTLPAVVGLTAGFSVILLSCCLGLAALFTTFPVMHIVLKLLGIAYLLYVAWRVATAVPQLGGAGGRPLSFWEGFITICISPQAWVFATSFVTAYLLPGRLWESVAVLLAVCVPARFVGGTFWAMSGHLLRAVLSSPRTVRTFNIAMALVMVACLWPIAADLWRQLKG